MKIYDYNGLKNVTGTNIKKARLKVGMSQTELSTKLQDLGVVIERDSISRIESGKRVVLDYELAQISKILNVPIITLIKIQEPK